jgi:hypothetical protein
MLYLECHITIEPVFDERLQEASQLAKKHNFRVADLLMKKRENDTEERSKYDTFMTGHSQDRDDLSVRTIKLVQDLQEAGFKVWRYKLEDAFVDSRIEDVFNLNVGKGK